jgi:TolB-like protein
MTTSPDSHLASPEILDALARIERSKLFANSKRLTELLRFVVEAQLRGDTEGLKQTAIGIDLYRRDPSYDPKLDGIVRTHARRLRERLAEYYQSEGAHDPVVIELPRGGYVPSFRRTEGSAIANGALDRKAEDWGGNRESLDFSVWDASEHPQPRATPTMLARVYSKLARFHLKVGRAHLFGLPLLILIPAFVLVIVVIAAVAWQRSNSLGKAAATAQHRLPRVAVLHFRSAGRGAESELFGRALADSVVASLARMNEVSVVEPPESSTGPSVDGTDAEIAEQLRVDYVVTGRFDKMKKLSRLTATLTDEHGGRVIWSRDYSFPWANLVEIEDAMAAAVSQSLAQRLRTTN